MHPANASSQLGKAHPTRYNDKDLNSHTAPFIQEDTSVFYILSECVCTLPSKSKTGTLGLQLSQVELVEKS